MKASLEPAFRDSLVPSQRLGMPVGEAPPQDLRQSHQELHFQPEARNEVLKGFELKLTRMSIAVPLPRGLFTFYCLVILVCLRC